MGSDRRTGIDVVPLPGFGEALARVKPAAHRYSFCDVPRGLYHRGRPSFLIQCAGFGERPIIVPLGVVTPPTLLRGLLSPTLPGTQCHLPA
jgi:hypothetical protein